MTKRKKAKVPKEFLIYQTPRALGDEHTDLPLAKAPVSIRLPVEVDEWVRLQGTAWLRNIICKIYYINKE